MVLLPLLLAVVGVWGGCSCQPTLPPPPPQDDNVTLPTGATAATGDTGPVPPCAVPETEPNDSISEPNWLTMERWGCGKINAPLDLDYWEFQLEDDAWLEIQVKGGNGSPANMTFFMTPDNAAWAASRNDDPEEQDATLRFQAPAGLYSMALSEQNFLGGDRFSYDVLVTEAKPPVEWTRQEVEDNNSAAQAENVNPGDVVYGTMTGNGAQPDFDWYTLTIPAGKHTLTIDIDAYDFGSSADLTVLLYDINLDNLPPGCVDPCPIGGSCVPCSLKGGIVGLEFDPFGEYVSPGAEVVFVQVLEAGGRESPANWYTLSVGLEGS